MWIVRLALRRPYTFIVLAILLLLLSPVVISRTPVDIFPEINIPVVSVLWNYGGLNAQEMTDRIVSNYERGLTTTVNDIEHIESQNLGGISVIKIYFQPKAKVEAAVAQVTAISQTVLRGMPQGTYPPLVIAYSASSVPIMQLSLKGDGLGEQQLNDYAVNFIRNQLATVQGASIPYPYGGKQRQIQVDISMPELQAKGLNAADVVNAINAQNLILPAGNTKIGTFEYNVELNGSPRVVDDLNELPIKTINGATIYIKDVAHVRDGSSPQTNIVHVDGQRASMLTIQKTGGASTLDIIARVREALPHIVDATKDPRLVVTPIADQSFFVRASINGVLKEAVIAACLTGLLILIFLGSWRSTIIIAVSIPLSILSSVLILSALGETINIMTLGGLALAVGILVDDATVEIENINRNLEQGKETETAILDGAMQIAVPAFVSTLAICIVFVPMFFLTGVAKYLFVPLAEAVVFAMLASYILSRTLVPTMAKYLLKKHSREAEEAKKTSHNPFVRFQQGFEYWFEQIRVGYEDILCACLRHRTSFLFLFLAFCIGSFAMFPWLGQDFFPKVDGGQFKLHFRAKTGTRIEETARLCAEIEDSIRKEIPSDELASLVDNIGLPYSSLNLSYSNSAPIGTADADILVALKAEHRPTEEYMQRLRKRLSQEYPGLIFYFPPADIISQILNFGLPAPIDVQIIGRDILGDRAIADKLIAKFRYIPGAVDLRIQQAFDQPKLFIDVDRTKAQGTGLSQRDVASNLLVALSGSFQTSPNFWLNPQNGVTYSIAVQSQQYDLDSMARMQNIPLGAAINGTQQTLGNLATMHRGAGLASISHYNAQPVIDIYGSVQNTDLGSVAKEINRIVAEERNSLPRGTEIKVRGQMETMRTSFNGLAYGLVFSIVLVYLLIVINFQSWLDPFIIISALPAALAGIVWMLFATHTTISVPALTGAVMCMGVATANSILVVSFAKERMMEGDGPLEAALTAGFTRFRPVLMTALAMIIGMVPMSLGLGEGGEQNAPLGRAVIGGLLFATVATLFFVPVFFTIMHGREVKKTQRRAAATQA